MFEVTVNRELKVSVEKTWDLLMDWGNTAWVPGLEKTEVVDAADGKMRRMFIPGREQPVEEILISADASSHTLHYKILRSEMFPFENYTGQVTLHESVHGGCWVEWTCGFEPGGLSETEALGQARKNLKALLDRLANYLEVYRVVQWATGRVGKVSMRGIIRHPQMQLVGVHVHSESKVGMDAGELCGIDPIGVSATSDLQTIIDLKPDCVVHMPEGYNLDELCALLEAGINVVTTRGEFFSSGTMEPQMRERIERACAKGGASIHANGVSPGFITEALPVVLASVGRRLDCLTIDEYAFMPGACTSEVLMHGLGYGKPAGTEFDRNLLGPVAQWFGDSLGTTAEALSIPVERFELSAETAAGNEVVELPDGARLEQGTIAALRITAAGMVGDRAVLRFRANWHCSTNIDKKWNLKENGWRVLVEGDAPLELDIRFPRTEAPFNDQMAGYTAFRAVNVVPAVCAARPGICTTLDLPRTYPRMECG